MYQDRRTYMQQRLGAMQTERSTFLPHYREINQFLAPRLGRFWQTDRNVGTKRHQSILNNSGGMALRSASAGLLAGTMSPTRPWVVLETPDPDMMRFEPVLEWLFKVQTLMQTIWSSSNLYTMAPAMFSELLAYGTGCVTQVDDFKDVTRFYTHTVGSYMLAQSDRYEIDTMVREFQMTVRQIMVRYGPNASQTVRNLYDRGTYEAWVPVVQFIEPNEVFDPAKPSNKFKAFSSTYYEPASPVNQPCLSESGFDEFPAHCPRWDLVGEDVYATDCPGMTALGDVKGLQAQERENAKAIEKMSNPPLKGPPSLRNVSVSSLPGGVTIYDGGSNHDKLEPIYTVTPQIQQAIAAVQHTEARIKEAFYVDLFRSIDSMEGVQPQNQLFLSMKNAEKLLQLGPVLERLHGEFLNKIVDRTFNQCLRAGILPPAPQELQGSVLKTRYISSLAMAQREVATQSIDKLTMFIGGLVQMGMTSALDKFDGDEAIDQYSRALGSPPTLIVPEDKVLAARQAKQKQADQQHQMEMLQQGAQAAQQGAQAVGTLAGASGQVGGAAPPAAVPGQ